MIWKQHMLGSGCGTACESATRIAAAPVAANPAAPGAPVAMPPLSLWLVLHQQTSKESTGDTESAPRSIALGIGLFLAGLFLFAGLVVLWVRRSIRRRRLGLERVLEETPRMPEELGSPAAVRLQRRLANVVGISLDELDDVAKVAPYAGGEEEGDAVCAVCLEEMEVGDKTRRLPCGHCFDARCIEEWVTKANRCPVCNVEPFEETALATKRAGDGGGARPPAARQRRRRQRGENGSFMLRDQRDVLDIDDEDTLGHEPPSTLTGVDDDAPATV